MDVKRRSGSRGRRLKWITGVFLVFLSVFSILVSLAMPGVGWTISAVTLIVASLSSPLIGKQYIGAALVISMVHVFTLGPLAGFRLQPGMEMGFTAVAVVLPFLVGLSFLFAGGRCK
jgi:hypothetical protein